MLSPSICVALAVYTQSPTAYEAVKGMGILQLPSISALKAFTSFNVEQAGFSEECLSHATNNNFQKKEASINVLLLALEILFVAAAATVYPKLFTIRYRAAEFSNG